LIRYWNGEREVWSVIRVPSWDAEDARHLHRELTTLKRDRTRVTPAIAQTNLAAQEDSRMVRPTMRDSIEHVIQVFGLNASWTVLTADTAHNSKLSSRREPG
jgi:hypothetical protein